MDELEDLARLRDRADGLAQRMAASGAAAAAFTGTGTTGAVTIAVEDSGQVRSVAVDRTWRERIGVEGLGEAVRAAVQEASVARLRVWADAFVEGDAAPDPRSRPAPLMHESLAYQLDELTTGDLTGAEGQAAMEELLALLESVDRGIDEVSERIAAHQAAAFTGRSQGGHVSVTVSGGGEVTEIRYDRRWLAGAHELNIGRETTEAFRAAYRRAGERTVADLVADSALGEAQALARDPLELARRMRLRKD